MRAYKSAYKEREVIGQGKFSKLILTHISKYDFIKHMSFS